MRSNTRRVERWVSAAGIVVLTAGATTLSLAPQSARALGPLDASGVQFDFVNASDVLRLGVSGNSFEYINVAEIDGVQIDATLTVTETFNLLGTDFFIFVDSAIKDFVNPSRPESDELVDTGCYEGQGNEFGYPDESILPSNFRVGSDTFTAATAWAAGSPFLEGSVLTVADEAIADDGEEDRAINTEITGCGGVTFASDPVTYEPIVAEYSFPAYVRYRIDFTSAGAPVQLTNLTLSAFDIDGGQYLRLFSPLPDSYRVFDTSELDVCGPASLQTAPCADEDEYAGSSGFLAGDGSSTLELYGDDASDDGEVYEWAAEATYSTALSSLSYQFGVRSGGGGSLAVSFDPIDWSPADGGEQDREAQSSETAEQTPAALAHTGSSQGSALLPLWGLLTVVAGALLLGIRTRKQTTSQARS